MISRRQQHTLTGIDLDIAVGRLSMSGRTTSRAGTPIHEYMGPALSAERSAGWYTNRSPRRGGAIWPASTLRIAYALIRKRSRFLTSLIQSGGRPRPDHVWPVFGS